MLIFSPVGAVAFDLLIFDVLKMSFYGENLSFPDWGVKLKLASF
jgi:hypothetical protein